MAKTDWRRRDVCKLPFIPGTAFADLAQIVFLILIASFWPSYGRKFRFDTFDRGATKWYFWPKRNQKPCSVLSNGVRPNGTFDQGATRNLVQYFRPWCDHFPISVLSTNDATYRELIRTVFGLFWKIALEHGLILYKRKIRNGVFTRLRSRRVVLCLVMMYLRSFVPSLIKPWVFNIFWPNLKYRKKKVLIKF